MNQQHEASSVSSVMSVCVKLSETRSLWETKGKWECVISPLDLAILSSWVTIWFVSINLDTLNYFCKNIVDVYCLLMSPVSCDLEMGNYSKDIDYLLIFNFLVNLLAVFEKIYCVYFSQTEQVDSQANWKLTNKQYPCCSYPSQNHKKLVTITDNKHQQYSCNC